MKWLRFLQRQLKPAVSAKVAYTEKRDTWRVFHEVPLEVLRAQGEKVEVQSANFGPGGMGVETSKPFKKGDEVTLIFEMPGVAARVKGRCVWVSRKKSGAHSVGFHFIDGPDGRARDFLRALLEDCRLSIQNPQERRRAPRVRVDMMSAELVLSGDTVRARVIDLSVGGAQVLCTRPLMRGTRFTMRIDLGNEVEALIFMARIVRQGATGELQTVPLSVQFLEVSEAQRLRIANFIAGLLQSD